MIVYRICHKKWANSLNASGKPARWNSAGRYVIYTSESRSLACLENVVHRSSEGLNELFKLMIIEIPIKVTVEELDIKKLPKTWSQNYHNPICKNIGDKWMERGEHAILRVPSAIVKGEFNYLLNPGHPDFVHVRLLKTESFEFDNRIKNV